MWGFSLGSIRLRPSPELLASLTNTLSRFSMLLRRSQCQPLSPSKEQRSSLPAGTSRRKGRNSSTLKASSQDHSTTCNHTPTAGEAIAEDTPTRENCNSR